MSTTIRLVDDLAAIEHFNALEHLIWGTPLLSTAPAHVVVTTIHNGGGLLGAYAPDGPPETGGMVGLTWWWPGLAAPTTTPAANALPPAAPHPAAEATPPTGAPGTHNRPGAHNTSAVHGTPGALGADNTPATQYTHSTPGTHDTHATPGTHDTHSTPGTHGAGALRLKMCSHMAGVLPAWRGAGLGLRLKLAQRAAILAQGATDWVTWTYDPLIRTNGAFNLHRLGALCNTYHVNVYGEVEEGINAGTPSDRCQVDWWLSSPRVAQLAHEHLPDAARRTAHHLPADTQILTARVLPSGFLAPPTTAPILDGRPLALPLPDDIYAIRAADQPLGRAWRQWQRATLQHAFAAGYLLVDCLHHDDHQWRYLLTRP
jgi:predicted GNAT superfamily acetyltransferase